MDGGHKITNKSRPFQSWSLAVVDFNANFPNMAIFLCQCSLCQCRLKFEKKKTWPKLLFYCLLFESRISL